MTESEVGQWFFVMMISLAIGWAIILAAWKRRMRRDRDNLLIVRRILGKKRGEK